MTRCGDHHEYSNSEVQSFLDCRRRWLLSYYRRLRPRGEAPVGPLSIGNRVHRALEEGYSTPGRADEMRRVLAESIEADYALAEQLGVVEQFEKECELAVIMLEGFVDWAAEEGMDAGWEVVSHERIVRTPTIEVAGEPVVLKGKLDQIIRRDMDGAMFMRDWKTTQTLNVVMMSFMPQLKTYLTLLALTEPEARVSGGQFVFLKKVKRTARAEPPFYRMEEAFVSNLEMATFWEQTVGTLGRMVEATARLEAGESHHAVAPPRPTRDCAWRCPFYHACPMFDDGSDVERYLADNYEAGDPYAYYEDPTKETE